MHMTPATAASNAIVDAVVLVQYLLSESRPIPMTLYESESLFNFLRAFSACERKLYEVHGDWGAVEPDFDEVLIAAYERWQLFLRQPVLQPVGLPQDKLEEYAAYATFYQMGLLPRRAVPAALRAIMPSRRHKRLRTA